MTEPRTVKVLDEAAVLDHGFVKLVDVMGDDEAIVESARISIAGIGVKAKQPTAGFLRYLMRHWHSTPFEMVEFKFCCKMPIFIARQWIRHRTANVNEMSGRYSEMPEEFYLPELADINYQDPKNKQMRGTPVRPELAKRFVNDLERRSKDAFDQYHSALGKGEIDPEFQAELVDNGGIAREIARIGLPLNTYTAWYWKIDLWNLFHFLHLRMDKHAQMEIRVYAEAMYRMIKKIVPLACAAFEDFRLNAVMLSAPEIAHLRAMIQALRHSPTEQPAAFPTTREGHEWMEKVARMGLL